MVGYRADAQCALSGPGGVHVKSRGLHLDGHDAHIAPLVVAVAAGGRVEIIAGQDIADLNVNAVLLCRLDGGASKRVVGDGSECAV